MLEWTYCLLQARRSFSALKGIIRLQALIRGHLVRRQAVSTLRTTWLIVKFQALVRGRNVRLSGAHMQLTLNFGQHKFGVSNTVSVAAHSSFLLFFLSGDRSLNYASYNSMQCLIFSISM
jgi:hypothetical protein